MTVLMNPDCLDGKHRACSGDGWCEQTDQAVPCPCSCHQKDREVEAFWQFFKDDIANAPVLTAAELGEHSMRSHMHRNDPPRADGQHYDGCPCPPCVDIRAARPEPPVPLAYLGCCSSIVRLTRTGPGTFTGIETHLPHCPDTGATFLPETKED